MEDDRLPAIVEPLDQYFKLSLGLSVLVPDVEVDLASAKAWLLNDVDEVGVTDRVGDI